MTINMPNKKRPQTTEEFIKKAPISESNMQNKQEDLNKTQNVSFTIQKRDIIWLNEIIEKLNGISRKRVNKSRLMTAGLILLQEKSESEILDILKEI